MINRLVVENFKSLRKVDLRLGRLNVFIGANASGKSNLFDALRVIQGIGYGFTIHEVLDGKPKGASSEVWEGIRGGSQRALTSGSLANIDRVKFTVHGSAETTSFDYSIGFAPAEGRVTTESLEGVFESNPKFAFPNTPSIWVKYWTGNQGRPPEESFDRNRPVLGQFSRASRVGVPAHAVEKAAKVALRLSDMQRLDPSPAILRSYSQAQEIKRMGEHGENFAALVKGICADPKSKEAFLSWLRELRPHELDDVGTLAGAVGEPLFMLRERTREYPAPVLSDGTLRFAAIAAAFFQPEMPGLLTIEEIENGIHASRLRLLVELLRSRATGGTTQLMVTSHSPLVLAWLKPEEYRTTFLCKRDENSGESRILPLTAIPHFEEVIRQQPVGELFSEGWLEGAA